MLHVQAKGRLLLENRRGAQGYFGKGLLFHGTMVISERHVIDSSSLAGWPELRGCLGMTAPVYHTAAAARIQARPAPRLAATRARALDTELAVTSQAGREAYAALALLALAPRRRMHNYC